MGTEKAEENGHKIIRFSRGKKNNFGKVTNRTAPLKRFVQLFAEENLVRTGETRAEYDKADDQEQLRLKAEAGFIYRTQVEGDRRNRESGRPSDMLSFDFDYTNREFAESLLNGTALRGIPHIVHTTRRHTPEDPRVRVYIPLDEAVDNETYSALARITCRDLIDPEMKYVDPVSFRPAQMMFLPTVSKDGEYRVHIDLDGDFLPGQAMLDRFEEEVGDWRDLRNLPTVESEGELREKSKRAEDPTEKEGPVGTFCRAYDVQDAIATFLSDVYEEVDEYSAKPRYTYLGGTTRNGAEVQDDGLFLYSHHGSDPVSDQLVNAFDLVRIHKFGHEDEGADLSKPMAQHPSWKAMIEFIGKDDGYRSQMADEKYSFASDIDDAFDDAYKKTGGTPLDDDDYGEDDESADSGDHEETLSPTELAEIEDLIGDDHIAPIYMEGADGLPILTAASVLPPEKPREDWLKNECVFNPANGVLENSASNVRVILQNDRRVFGAIQYNEFTHERVLRKPVDFKIMGLSPIPLRNHADGDPWEDYHEDMLRMMLEATNDKKTKGYGMKVADRDMRSAINVVSKDHRFHPVRSKLIEVNRAWDGKHRLETFFIDFLGLTDNQYHRDVARLWFVAAVARIFEPGHKFDYVPVIEGAQGIGKSTLIEIVAMGWFGHLTANFNNPQKLMEEMLGAWIAELPEMANLARGEAEDAKAFITQTRNVVRMAYARNATVFERQQVFIGTTNREDYLRDPTGNRRFWPLVATVYDVDFAKLKTVIEQVWAEAVQVYREMRAEQPTGTLPLYLQDEESKEEALRLQESRRARDQSDAFEDIITDYVNTPRQADVDGLEVGDWHYVHKLRTTDVAVDILGVDPTDQKLRSVQMEVAKAFKRMGWERQQTSVWEQREGDFKKRRYAWDGYVRPMLEQIEMDKKTAEMNADPFDKDEDDKNALI